MQLVLFGKERTEEQEAAAFLKLNTNLGHDEHLIFQLSCFMLLSNIRDQMIPELALRFYLITKLMSFVSNSTKL